MKTKNRIWLNILFVVLILAVLIIVVCLKGDVKSIFNAITSCNKAYLFIAIGLIIIFLICTAASLQILVRVRHKLNIFDSFNIANCAQFYNGITPFQSGGQPFQVYYYTKVNIKPDESTSIIMMNFIIHQLVLNILSVVALILYFDDLFTNSTFLFRVAVIVGFSINFIILLVLIFVSISVRVKRFFLWIIGGVTKLKIFRKKREDILAKANDFFDKSQNSFKELFSHIWALIFSVLVKVISLVAYFLVPYFIFKSLNISVGKEDILFIFWMTAFAFVIMSFMPTPGASGGAEWAFTSVFATMYVGLEGDTLLSSLLIWRFLTYYLVMILGCISTLFIRKRKEDDSICELESSQTALSHKSTE